MLKQIFIASRFDADDVTTILIKFYSEASSAAHLTLIASGEIAGKGQVRLLC